MTGTPATPDPQSSLSEFINTAPRTARVFESFGLDYCCHGQRPLGDACDDAGVRTEAVLAALGKAIHEEASGTADDDTHLLPGSPCIDSADASALPVQVSLDLSGDPRYMDDPGTADSGLGTPSFLDRGCYEFQGTSAPPCLADLDGDGLVDGADLGLLLANWGGAGSGDLDGSGTIDGADLGLLLAAWGNC